MRCEPSRTIGSRNQRHRADRVDGVGEDDAVSHQSLQRPAVTDGPNPEASLLIAPQCILVHMQPARSRGLPGPPRAAAVEARRQGSVRVQTPRLAVGLGDLRPRADVPQERALADAKPRQNPRVAGARRPAVVAPRIHVVAVDAAANASTIIEEELVRSRYFSLASSTLRKTTKPRSSRCARAAAPSATSNLSTSTKRGGFRDAGRYLGAKRAARFRTHA